MGGCAGKHKSKSTKIKLETKSKDNQNQTKSENVTLENNGESANLKENDVDNEYDGINKAISQILSSHIVSVSDSELDIEFANLVYGHPENEYAENPIIAAKFQSTEV